MINQSSGQMPYVLTKVQYEELNNFKAHFFILRQQYDKLCQERETNGNFKREEPPLMKSQYLSSSPLGVSSLAVSTLAVSKKPSIKMVEQATISTSINQSKMMEVESYADQEVEQLKRQKEELTISYGRREQDYQKLYSIYTGVVNRCDELERMANNAKNYYIEIEDKLTSEIQKLKGQVKQLIKIKQQKNTRINQLQYLIQDIQQAIKNQSSNNILASAIDTKIQGRVVRVDFLKKIQHLQQVIDVMKTDRETNDFKLSKKEKGLKKENKDLTDKVKELEKNNQELKERVNEWITSSVYNSGLLQDNKKQKKEGEKSINSSENNSLKGSKEINKEVSVGNNNDNITVSKNIR